MKNWQMDPEQYQAQVNARMPKSNTLAFCLRAFWVGGLICVIGQGVQDFFRLVCGLEQDALSAATAMTMVFLGALLTGIGVYDKIGAYAGAGSVVPITGFANSVVAPAIEFKPEGLVMGVAAKMFNLAGPVLVYGIGASIAAGLIKLILDAL